MCLGECIHPAGLIGSFNVNLRSTGSAELLKTKFLVKKLAFLMYIDVYILYFNGINNIQNGVEVTLCLSVYLSALTF